MTIQRDAISECKFCQALFVEFLEKFGGPFIYFEGAARQYLWYKCLVIADPRQQQDQAENPVEHFSGRRRKLPRNKIKDQLLFEPWAVKVAVAERQSRSRWVV